MTDPVRVPEERHLHAVDTPAEGLDVPAPTPETPKTAQPLEIVPACLRTKAAFVGLVRERATHGAQVTAWHTVRLPAYWVRTWPYAARTVAALVVVTSRWGADAKGRAVRTGLAAAPAGPSEGTTYWRLTHQHWAALRVRLVVLAALALACVVGTRWAWTHAPWWAWLLAAVAVPPLLAIPARDPEKPITESSRYAGHITPPVDERLVTEALCSLGHAALTKGLREDRLRLVSPIHRDGPGWRADIDLPGGVPAGEVIERRARLAAGLRRPLKCVWPSADPDAHEARLTLWVGDQTDRKGGGPWPLATRGRTDIFGKLPLGVTPQGHPVALSLMYASMLIGAVPRMGKTFALRLLLLGAALDPIVEIRAHDLKGGVDLRSTSLFAHRYRSGDEDEDIAYLADGVDELGAEMRRRYKILRGLSEKECPEGKITPQLARQARLRFRPIVIGIDECHVAFEHPKYGARIEEGITDLVKRGPAVGIIVILATQRPDAKSIPAPISSNAILRLCMMVMDHRPNDMVLGSGMHRAGYRATTFTRSDLGIGWLVGDGDDPVIVQTYYLDGPGAKTVAARARAARQAAGTLTGYAAGLDVDPEPTPTLLDDLAAVIPEGGRIRLEEALPRLVAYRPGTYDGWSPADLGHAVRACELDTVQVSRREDGRQTNRRGIDMNDVTRMITERDEGE